MESGNSWLGSMSEAVWEQIRLGIDYLPSVIAVLIILLVGWLLARLARVAVQRLALAVNQFLDSAFPRSILPTSRISSIMATLFGEVVFWVILLLAVTVGADVAGLTAIAELLDRLTTSLPQLIAGIAIIVLGYFLSVYVREQIAARDVTGRPSQLTMLGGILQAAIFATALVVGLDQIGIDVALLVALLVTIIAALLLGFAAAFALGARSHVSNLIGIRAARSYLSAGVRIRIDEVEGEILEITPTQIAVNTEQGKTFIPGRFIDERLVTILAPETDESEAAPDA